MGLPSQRPLKKKNFNTVHNLITISIVFTNFFFFFFCLLFFMIFFIKIFYYRAKLNLKKCFHPLYFPPFFQQMVNLSYDGGGPYVPPQSVFKKKKKISPPDQTLRPTCKFLILGLLYHEFFFLFIIQYIKSFTI